MSRISARWRRMAEIYRMFADEPGLDFSEEAAVAMYAFESSGKGDLRQGLFGSSGPLNGFAVGKHWMDATVKMWLQDIRDGVLFVSELYCPREGEEAFPHWWLDRVIPKPRMK